MIYIFLEKSHICILALFVYRHDIKYTPYALDMNTYAYVLPQTPSEHIITPISFAINFAAVKISAFGEQLTQLRTGRICV